MYVCRYVVCMYVETSTYHPPRYLCITSKMRLNVCFCPREDSGAKTNVLSVFCVT